MSVGEEKGIILESGERIMSEIEENHQPEGKEKVVTLKTYYAIISAFTAISLITVLLVAPLKVETRIYIQVERDMINDVWVETIRVPFISSLFPPSHKVGAYTINVSIQPSDDKFTISEVPSGKYSIVWSDIQSGTFYTITVTLIKQELVIDTFVLNIAF